MTKNAVFGLTVAVAFFSTASMAVSVAPFDDTTSNTIEMDPGYCGFDWKVSTYQVLKASMVGIDEKTGYFHDTYVNSGYNLLDPGGVVAFGYGGWPGSTISLIGDGTFTFITAKWRSVWDAEQVLTLQGFNNGQLIYQSTYSIYRYLRTVETSLNWAGIDQLRIASSGPNQWAMDDFTFDIAEASVAEPGTTAPIPEPGTIALLSTGILCLAGTARRRKKKQLVLRRVQEAVAEG